MTAGYSVVSRTDVGRVRTNNEDSFLADEPAGVFVVCDGMGGHNAGEVASKICCDVVRHELGEAIKQRDKQAAAGRAVDVLALRRGMEAAVAAACKEIHRQASRTSEHAGMGTTCTALVLSGTGKAVFGHVGDSRLYVLRGGQVHQLSEDHTYVNELVRRGALDREQAKNHPQGNVLSRAMGVQAAVSVDTMIFDLDVDDTLMLCSDGVYNYYDDSREIGLVIGDAELARGRDEVIDRALKRGGHDNCTAVLLRVVPGAQVAQPSADARVAMLKQLPVFAHLTYLELLRVVGISQVEEVPAGATIAAQDEPATALHVVLTGEVALRRDGAAVGEAGPGAHLGETAMFDRAPRATAAQARHDTSLLVLGRDDLFWLLRQDPVLASKMLFSFIRAVDGHLHDHAEVLAAASSPDDDLHVFIDA